MIYLFMHACNASNQDAHFSVVTQQLVYHLDFDFHTYKYDFAFMHSKLNI